MTLSLHAPSLRNKVAKHCGRTNHLTKCMCLKFQLPRCIKKRPALSSNSLNCERKHRDREWDVSITGLVIEELDSVLYSSIMTPSFV